MPNKPLTKASFIKTLQPLLCSLYLEPYTSTTHIPVELPSCGHIFCRNCLLNGLEFDSPYSNRCPLCRDELFALENAEGDGDGGDDGEGEEEVVVGGAEIQDLDAEYEDEGDNEDPDRVFADINSPEEQQAEEYNIDVNVQAALQTLMATDVRVSGRIWVSDIADGDIDDEDSGDERDDEDDDDDDEDYHEEQDGKRDDDDDDDDEMQDGNEVDVDIRWKRADLDIDVDMLDAAY